MGAEERPASTVELLAPVPFEHLKTGRNVLANEEYVAFGSRAWELFEELDRKRADRPVRAGIYASSSDDPSARLAASWTCLYVGHVRSLGGAHPEGMRFRPPTTEKYADDNEGYWAIFWHVVDLRELSTEEWQPVSQMTSLKGRKPYGHPFVPEGPILIRPVGGPP